MSLCVIAGIATGSGHLPSVPRPCVPLGGRLPGASTRLCVAASAVSPAAPVSRRAPLSGSVWRPAGWPASRRRRSWTGPAVLIALPDRRPGPAPHRIRGFRRRRRAVWPGRRGGPGIDRRRSAAVSAARPPRHPPPHLPRRAASRAHLRASHPAQPDSEGTTACEPRTHPLHRRQLSHRAHWTLDFSEVLGKKRTNKRLTNVIRDVGHYTIKRWACW